MRHYKYTLPKLTTAWKLLNREDLSKPSIMFCITALERANWDDYFLFTALLIQLGFNKTYLTISDNRIHIGTRIEMRVVTLGLDGAGKTSILFKLKNDEFVSTIPTIGFNVETIEYKNFKFTVWDVGGQPKLRPLWRHYYFNTQAVIFVIDATNVDRLLEAQSELNKLMTEKELKDASLLIFANKSGDPNALATSTLTETLGLQKLCLGRSWHLHPCDAQSGLGLQQGLD
ncbi:E3 ubiquitin-protein ligase TRIM23, partial [Armadillidium vulgare]